ncbi:MAG: elongation factor G [Proteobacteria bacterium]|nr:elongation factor G [Pseudomonadota bacterium]
MPYAPSDIRNIALVGHGVSGKTSLAEALLFNTGATSRLGEAGSATSTLDFEPEEHKRGGTIGSSFAWVEHDGHKVNVIDTPGDGNFIFDAFTAMQGADAAYIVVSAPDGIEVQTEAVYRRAVELGIPRVFVLNKMDRERADYKKVLAEIEENFGAKPVPLQVPLGQEDSFGGVVSLMQMKALRYKRDGSGASEKGAIPDELSEAVAAAWENLVECVAETDEELLEKYLDTFELSEDEVKRGFQAALKKGELVPVLYTCATGNVAVQALLDLAVWAVPSPLEREPFDGTDATGDPIEVVVAEDGPFYAQVVKTFMDEFSGKVTIFRVFSGTSPTDGGVTNTSNGGHERLGALYALRGTNRDAVQHAVTGDIVSVAKLKDTHTNETLTDSGTAALPAQTYPAPMMEYTITATSKGDEDKLKTAVERLIEEDPTLVRGYDDLSKAMVLRGMGQAHLDLSVEKMRRKFKVAVATDLPAVPYRETLRKPVKHVEGKHKKQTGGAGQFGVCFLDVEPLPRNSGFEFVDKIHGGSIPKQLIPSVEKGIRARMGSGPAAGYPIVDFRVTLTDGKYHPVDSKDVAFQMAGSKGLQAALVKGGVKILEPVYNMHIVVPSESMGDIMGDITSRRGRVMGMEPRGNKTVIEASAPLAEIQRYAPDLRSMTAGKGTFTMDFGGYEEVPGNLQDKIIAESPFRREHE